MENKVTEKKLDYSFESKNFAIDGELTVTITLCEYRELIKTAATKDEAIKKAEAGRWDRENEIKKLKDENAALKAELYELKKRLDNVGAEAISEPIDDGGDY